MNKQGTQASRGGFALENLQSLFVQDLIGPTPSRVARSPLRCEDDAAYYQRRAAEQRAIAVASCQPRSRLLHLELAERYAARAAAIREVDEQLGKQPAWPLGEQV